MTSLIDQFLVSLTESEGHWVRLLHNQPHDVAAALADNKRNITTRQTVKKQVTKPSQITSRAGKFSFRGRF